MSDILEKIRLRYDEKNLKVAFIRLDSGKEKQLENIKQKRLYIGYNSSNEQIFKALNESKLKVDEFKKMVINEMTDKGDKNNLAPSSLKTIYEDDGNTLWFTIIDGLLYYGFTDQGEKFEKFQGGCIRKMEANGWYYKDTKGNEINERSVSGKITKKRIFQGTTSEVHKDDVIYLVCRILNKDTVERELAVESQNNLLGCVEKLLSQLNEYDFETLVEMLFLSQGYEKIAKSSGAEKSFDLVLKRPFDRGVDINKPTFVQIKSTADKKVVTNVLDDFISDKSFRDYHNIGFLVTHSFDEKLGTSYPNKNKELRIIGPAQIARQCVEFGKVDWLLDKVV